jgi:superfamily II DNA or RNA helicase
VQQSTGESSRTSAYRELISLSKVNETYLRVDCNRGLSQELNEFFSFYAPGYKFMPAYKNRMWDGRIRLYNLNNQMLYVGLLPYIKSFCRERDYILEYDDDLEQLQQFSFNEAIEFAQTLGMPHEPRKYQLEALVHSIRHNRSMILSPTGSGKSMIIYMLSRFYGEKTLVIVPTVSLVRQMYTDFRDYGYDQECKLITAGVDKQNIEEDITITTWQSVFRMPRTWFDQFNVVIGDEAHLFKAKSLTDIMTKLSECKYRFGFTGTLDGTETHKLVLEGLFGEVKSFVNTKQLMDSNTLAELKIKILVLKYSEQTCKDHKNDKFQDEIDFILRNDKRNNFIKNLTLPLEGNTLILYQYVDRHGKVLHDLIKQHINKERKLFFVFGGTDGQTREAVRSITEKETNAIIIASFGTFSTGINIRNLHNIIFASPSKSRIRNLQSIGRGLRKSDSKTACVLYDIADDLQHNKHVNYTLRHLYERVKIYNEEQFDYKLYKIKLEN